MTESKLQNRFLGYARVSTYGPTPNAQIDQLRSNPVSGGAVGRHYHQHWDVERDLIRARTAGGRGRAKARGQNMGHRAKLTRQ